jgi:hypothetical protein
VIYAWKDHILVTLLRRVTEMCRDLVKIESSHLGYPAEKVNWIVTLTFGLPC